LIQNELKLSGFGGLFFNATLGLPNALKMYFSLLSSFESCFFQGS